MELPDPLQAELDRASHVLQDLAGEDVDTISVKAGAPDEAPFMARIVSKLSPMVGNLMEQRIVSILDADASEGYSWERQDPGFPDAILKHLDVATTAGYEIKAWYVLSTEITGRFRESLNLLAGKNINVVIVAWCMSNMVFGTPKVLGVLTVSGEELASSRDTHYHNPPEYLIEEPNDTTARTANLQQSNVNGFKLQDRGDKRLLAEERGRTWPRIDPHSPEAQAEVQRLKAILPYRLDTNFAKIDRVGNAEVEAFKWDILGSTYLNKTIRQWSSIFSDLNSAEDRKREKAEKVIEDLYSSMLVAEPRTEVVRETPDAH